MRIKFQDELLVIDTLTVLLILIIAFTPLDVLRVILGLPVALFFPGYTLLVALFPGRDDLGSIERIALSFGVSVLVVALIGLILNYTPWLGIKLDTVLGSTTLFILAASVAAFWKRRRLSPDERSGFSFSFRMTKWAEASRIDKVLGIGVAAAIILALGMLGYAVAERDVGERFTGFYVLGLDGNPGAYPEELVLGEEARVILGIVNQEHEDMSYRVVVVVDGEISEEIVPVPLAYRERWEEEVGFTPARAGEDQMVEFLLYQSGEAEAYQRLYLWIDVKR